MAQLAEGALGKEATVVAPSWTQAEQQPLAVVQLVSVTVRHDEYYARPETAARKPPGACATGP